MKKLPPRRARSRAEGLDGKGFVASSPFPQGYTGIRGGSKNACLRHPSRTAGRDFAELPPQRGSS
jgi:hypothetical protein